MKLVCTLFALRHCSEQFFRCILRMACHKSDQKLTRNIIYHSYQIRKICSAVKILPVGIDVLSKQCNIFIPFRHKFLRFGDNIFRQSRAFSSPYVRYNAVRAEIVAPIHDGKPCFYRAVSFQRYALCHGAVCLGSRKNTFMACHYIQQQFRKSPEFMRAEYQIYNRVGFLDLFCHMLLLYHTAAYGNNLLRFCLFCVVECTDIPQHTHFCMFSYRTGIHNDDICLEFILRKSVSHLRKISSDFLTVRFILLAAVGIHHGKRMSPGSIDTFKDLSADCSLSPDLLFADGLPFIHAVPPYLLSALAFYYILLYA